MLPAREDLLNELAELREEVVEAKAYAAKHAKHHNDMIGEGWVGGGGGGRGEEGGHHNDMIGEGWGGGGRRGGTTMT